MPQGELIRTTVAQAESISVSFRASEAVLTSVNLTIESGRVLGLLGPNGAGKSTLMRTMVGLLSPSSGRWATPASREVGALIDEPGLHPWQTVEQHLAFVADQVEADRSEVDRVIGLVGLISQRGRRITKLSHGMRQRLGIGTALVGDPSLVILDEPFNGLDPVQVDEMTAVIRAIAAAGRAVLISTHALNIARAACDECAILAEGKIISTASIGELTTEQLEDLYRSSVNPRATQ